MKSFKHILHEAINVTDNTNFWKWFGKSEVVDRHSNPLVVYHGTDANIIAFNPHHPPVNDDGYMGRGCYFISYITDASGYADMAADYNEDWGDGRGNPTVYPVYLSVQNPYNLKTMNNSGSYGMERDKVEAWTDELIAQGYDGSTNGAGEWCVFHATQIKSAIGNNGDFNPNNPDITK